MEVIAVAAAATHALRRRVLRAGDPAAVVAFDGDDDATTVHLAVHSEESDVRDDVRDDDRDDDRDDLTDDELSTTLLGVSTWLVRPFAGRPQSTAVQLRGLAVDPRHQGHGVGTSLVTAGVRWAGSIGAELVWARARDTALDFYVRHGFRIIGDGYVDATTGLPHHDVVLPLDAALRRR